MPKVAIIGGGISALAAAHRLADHPNLEVTIFESSSQFGGKLQTQPFGNLSLDTGPDSFLARRPEAIRLCEELGIDNELVSPNHAGAYVWSRGRLRSLPAGLMLGVPTDFIAVAKSGILSFAGLLRALVEPALPGKALTGDLSLGAVVRKRLGNEVLERLVDPLVGGINAGNTDHLSIRAVAPQLSELAERHRSLILGSRGHRPPKPDPNKPGPPIFLAFPTGISRLVEVLIESLTKAGVKLQESTQVEAVTRLDSGAGFEVRTNQGTQIADWVIVATPAPTTAQLVKSIAPAVSEFFASIEYASVALVALSFAREDFPASLEGSGFLVPRNEGFLTTACSWSSGKWAHINSQAPDRVIFRVSVGRVDDKRWMELDNEILVEKILEELVQLMGLVAKPIDVRVSRWPDALPQFAPGHFERLNSLQSKLHNDLPGLVLAGAALGGVGIPACIQSGNAAAAHLLVLESS